MGKGNTITSFKFRAVIISVLLVASFGIGLWQYLSRRNRSKSKTNKSDRNRQRLQSSADDRKKYTFTQTNGMVDLKDSNTEVFTEVLSPDDANPVVQVLMMHGARFSADTWLEEGIAQKLAEGGCKVILVNLPGKPPSPSASGVTDTLLSDLLDNYPLNHTVLVTPSASGAYATAGLENSGGRVDVWVPVAAGAVTSWDGLPAKQSTELRVHAVRGERDTFYEANAKHLKGLFPNFDVTVFPNADHAAYLATEEAPDSPQLFVDLVSTEAQALLED